MNEQPTFLRHILGAVAGYGLLTTTGDEHKQVCLSTALISKKIFRHLCIDEKSHESRLQYLGSEWTLVCFYQCFCWMHNPTTDTDIYYDTADTYELQSLFRNRYLHVKSLLDLRRSCVSTSLLPNSEVLSRKSKSMNGVCSHSILRIDPHTNKKKHS